MSADGGTAPPKGSTSHCQTASSTSWGFPALPANLNPSNRPVRTRMPGGVAGDVELKLHAPMPIAMTVQLSTPAQQQKSAISRTEYSAGILSAPSCDSARG